MTMTLYTLSLAAVLYVLYVGATCHSDKNDMFQNT